VADHGFLLRRSSGASGRGVLTHGLGYDALPRYAIYEHATPGPDQIGVPFDKLLYAGTNRALLMPRGIDVYQSGKDRDYVHGGNSPQERVIPVLTLRHKIGPGGDTQAYALKVVDTGQSSPTVFKVVARVDPMQQTGLSFAQAASVAVELQPADGVGVRCTLVDVGGAASLDGRRVQVEVARDFELYFRLRGPSAGRVRITLLEGDGRYHVEPVTTKERFDIAVDPSLAPSVASGRSTSEPAKPADPVARAAPEAPAAPTATDEAASVPVPAPVPVPAHSWLASIEDEGHRRAFERIERTGHITEQDLIAVLGNARKARRFASEFEMLAKRAPFKVSIEVTGTEKRYVRK